MVVKTNTIDGDGYANCKFSEFYVNAKEKFLYE